MKKIIALALALIMVLSMGTVAFAAETTVTSVDELKTALADSTIDTIKLGNNISGGGVQITRAVTIDFGGYTYTTTGGVGSSGTPHNGMHIDTSANVTLKNGTLAADGGIYILVQNYSNLTVENMTLDMSGSTWPTCSHCTTYEGDTDPTYALCNNGNHEVTTNIVNSTLIARPGENAMDVYAKANGVTVNVDANSTLKGNVEVGNNGTNTDAKLNLDGTITGNVIVADTIPAANVDTTDASFQNLSGTSNPGNEITVATNKPRTTYKVKGYDFTTGTEGYRGASYIKEVKIDKNGNVLLILKENYKLAEDKTIKGEIELYNKTTKTSEFIEVEYTVKNTVNEDIPGARKAKDAADYSITPDENTIYIMDEDGGYVSFSEEMLSGVVKMNPEEKVFLNIWYGNENDTTEDIIDAIEAELGEDYVDEAIIEYYTFETRAFKNEVAFSYEAYEDDPHFFYLWNDGKLTKIDATYDDDEDVEAWVWNAIAEGTIIVTDVEIVLADETTKNPDTGANDVVGVAAALAVVSLIAAGAVSLKK